MPNFTRRKIALASLATLATALAPKDRAFAQKKYGPGVSDTEIKVGQTIAYSGPVLGLRPDRHRRNCLFQDDQRPWRHQWPQDQFHFNRRRLQSAQSGRTDPPTGRTGRSSRDVRHAGYTAEPRDPHLFEYQKGAATVRRRWLRAVRQPGEISLDHRLSAEALVSRHLFGRAILVAISRPRSACSTSLTISARSCWWPE